MFTDWEKDRLLRVVEEKTCYYTYKVQRIEAAIKESGGTIPEVYSLRNTLIKYEALRDKLKAL